MGGQEENMPQGIWLSEMATTLEGRWSMFWPQQLPSLTFLLFVLNTHWTRSTDSSRLANNASM